MSGGEQNNEQNAPVVLNKLQMDAMMADIIKTLRATGLNNPNMFFNAGQASQARQDVRNKRRSRIPSFYGRNDDYFAWELEMELVFDDQDYSEGKKVRLATKGFSGDAIQWWDQLVTTRRRTGEAQVASWFELKHFMKKDFVSGNYSSKQSRKAKEESRSFRSHEQPSKSQSPRQRSSEKRPPSDFEGPKRCSKKEQVIRKLKTKPAKEMKESETEHEFSLVSPQTEFIFSNAYDKLTCFEPVQPSRVVSVPQVEEEHAAEAAQESVPQEEVSEQPNNMEAETNVEPFSMDSQMHCKEFSMVSNLPEMFVMVSFNDEKRFGLQNVKELCVSSSVFDSMFHSLKKLEPDKILDQKRFQFVVDNIPGHVLNFDQFLEHKESFDRTEKRLELVLQQPVICSRKSFDSFVFKDNGLIRSCFKHEFVNDDLFATAHALNKFKKLQELKSLSAEFHSVLKLTQSCSETDFHCESVLKLGMFWFVLKSLLENCIVLSFADILVYNTFFEKQAEPLLSNSQFEIDLVF